MVHSWQLMAEVNNPSVVGFEGDCPSLYVYEFL